MKCPTCKSEARRVIYMGFPMWLCQIEYCSTIWGVWSWVPALWFNGAFMEYDGWYLPALWHWLFGKME